MSTTTPVDIEATREVSSRHLLAHRYCWHCNTGPLAGSVAFCGNRHDGTHRPKADRCVVCLEMEPLGCPKCGVS